MEHMQTDNYNVFAEMARPVLLKYIDMTRLSAAEKSYIIKLKNWNLKSDINEQGPVIFKLWWDEFEKAVFNDEFSKTGLPLKWPDESTLLEGVLKDSTYKFIDDVNTPPVESVYEIVMKAYKQAYAQLKDLDNKQQLSWGKFKDTGIKHLLKLPAFGRPHLPIGGGENIINAATADHGPSWRMIVQLTNKTEAVGVYPGGQSGNPGSKYYDTFIDTWAAGKYYPLLFLNHEDAKKSNDIKWTMTFTKE
jgi:penicillin amidase